MNVYLLMEEAGEYEQSDVIGVFSTLERAKEIQSRLDGEGTEILETRVDDPFLKETLFSVNQYQVKIVPDEGGVTVTKEPFSRFHIGRKPTVHLYTNGVLPFVRVFCAAKDEEEAIKIACDAMDEFIGKKLDYEKWVKSKNA